MLAILFYIQVLLFLKFTKMSGTKIFFIKSIRYVNKFRVVNVQLTMGIFITKFTFVKLS